MQHQEGFLEGAQGNKLYHQSWLPEEGVKASLVVLHGLAEHSGRYMNLVDRFVPHGYAVYGIDHSGHGKSSGQRLYVERFSDYTDPLQHFVDQIRQWQPGKPVFMVGHSMGGLIAASYLLTRQEGLSGVVLSGPAIKAPSRLSPVAVWIGRLLSPLFPRLGMVPLETEGLSRDSATMAAYLTDPLVSRGNITARLGIEMLDAMARILREAGRITLPLLIVQGGADQLVDPVGARLFCDAVSSTDKKLILYEGLYHEVFNEPERERVLADVEQWLDAHLDRRENG